MAGNGRRTMNTLRDRWNQTSQDVPALREMRDWYRRWVHMREVRYQYLAAILDDVDGFRAEAQRQRASAEPRSHAGRSQCIGAPSIDNGGDRRCASPHGVCSIAGSRSAAVSCAKADEAG
jgi:hypothetical protein